MSSIETVTYNTAEDFLKELSLCNSSWWEQNSNCEWIFRGQSSNSQLIPSLYRKLNSNTSSELAYQTIFSKLHTKLIDTVPNMDATINNMVGDNRYRLSEIQKRNLSEIIKAAFIEIMLTENFLLECNRVRLSTPTLKLFEAQHSGISSVKYFYNRLINDLVADFTHHNFGFKIQLRSGFRRLVEFHYPESYAIARHHNILSRLLDWSQEPLIAGFFSAFNHTGEDNIAVWALNKKYLNANIGYGQISFYDKLTKSGLEFLSLQKGLFTDMLGAETYYYTHGEWPTLDQYLLTTYTNHVHVPIPQNQYLRKIELIASEKEELLRRLNRMDISKHTLMPTYDNVSQSIMNK
ncbi:MAG: FRG domain-containing protein [Pseudomonadota bacterium]